MLSQLLIYYRSGYSQPANSLPRFMELPDRWACHYADQHSNSMEESIIQSPRNWDQRHKSLKPGLSQMPSSAQKLVTSLSRIILFSQAERAIEKIGKIITSSCFGTLSNPAHVFLVSYQGPYFAISPAYTANWEQPHLQHRHSSMEKEHGITKGRKDRQYRWYSYWYCKCGE